MHVLVSRAARGERSSPASPSNRKSSRRTGTSAKPRTCSACTSRDIRVWAISCCTTTPGRKASSRCDAASMRDAAMRNRLPDADWRPRRIVHEPGAFVMPIGPKFSGVTESVHFLLETVGEDVIRSSTRLFYKWRAVEKLAEGKSRRRRRCSSRSASPRRRHSRTGWLSARPSRPSAASSVPAARTPAARLPGRARTPAPARGRDPGDLRIHGAGRRHQPGRIAGGRLAARLAAS